MGWGWLSTAFRSRSVNLNPSPPIWYFMHHLCFKQNNTQAVAGNGGEPVVHLGSREIYKGGKKRELKVVRGVFACVKPWDGSRVFNSFLKICVKMEEILCWLRSLSIMDIVCVIKTWGLVKAEQNCEHTPLKMLFTYWFCCIKSSHSKINHFSLTRVQNSIKLTNNIVY